VWRLDGAFIEILQAIYPYLRVKRKQALLLYNIHLLNQVTKGHRKQSKKLLAQKDLLYRLVKACNQREEVDLPDWMEDIPRYTGKPMWIVRNDVVWAKVAPMPESVSGWTWQRCRVKEGPSRVNRYGLQVDGSPTSGDLHHGENQTTWTHSVPWGNCRMTETAVSSPPSMAGEFTPWQ